MSNILVIGGSYFCGRVFVEEATKKGSHQVTVLNRGRIPMGMKGVRELRCDRHNPAALRECLAGTSWDTLVDFCAYTPPDVRDLLASLDSGSVGHYVLVSTASVYGKTSRLPVSEAEALLAGPLPGDDLGADYAWAKVCTERALQDTCGKRDVPWTIVRPAIIYGKYNYAPRESWFFDQIMAGSPITVPSDSLALFSFVSVWDLARLIISFIGSQRSFHHAFNAAGRELVSYDELLRVIEASVGYAFLTKPKTCRELAESGQELPFPFDTHLVYSGALSEECFGFRYTSFQAEMKRTWTYYSVAMKPDTTK